MEAAEGTGLAGQNVTFSGLLRANELMAKFREEVDVLFVPMSFDPMIEQHGA